jgi:hypothetical protein
MYNDDYRTKSVYLLDLCIFAYQLHSQTLLWPMDPYYEQMEKISGQERRTFKKFVGNSEAGFVSNLADFDANDLRGPGQLVNRDEKSGWLPNRFLDPIISRYRQIYPWRLGFTRPEPGQWLIYNTPESITHRINTVKIAQYARNRGFYHADSPQVEIKTLHPNRPIQSDIPATDWLYCFEGGTGAIGGDKARPAAWSLMGYVLAREVTNSPNDYDLYIVFRGSRSGDPRAERAGLRREGNPDWVTDSDFRKFVADQEICIRGRACRGFSTSLKTMLPTIFACLTEIETTKRRLPRDIYVTGHSLGGALAALFTSMAHCGSRAQFSALGDGEVRPPPRSIFERPPQLITYGSPGIGDEDFQAFYKLVNPKSYRIWLDGDFVAEAPFNKEHVGTELKIPRKSETIFPEFEPHEPYLTRRRIVELIEERFFPARFDHVPANTGEEHNDEPMKNYKKTNLGKALEHVQLTGNRKLFSDSLRDFHISFCLYLNFLKNVQIEANADPDTAKKITDVVDKLMTRNFAQLDDTPKKLLATLAESFDALERSKAFDKKYRAFLRGCLFLIAVGKNVHVLEAENDKNYKKLLTEDF